MDSCHMFSHTFKALCAALTHITSIAAAGNTRHGNQTGTAFSLRGSRGNDLWDAMSFIRGYY